MPKDDHPPSFPFYVDDFISDSAVDAMTNEELGMYVRLMCKAWKEDEVGTIPNDDGILASWSKATKAAWKKCRYGVLRAFHLIGERWHQKRMKLEWDKLLARRVERQQAGSKGGSKTQAKLRANGQAKSSLSVSPSISVSEDDRDGAIDSSFSENARARAKRIASYVKPLTKFDWETVAKVAKLEDLGQIAQNDVEQVLESYAAAEHPIDNPPAWFHECLSNRVGNLNQLLSITQVPQEFSR